MAATPPVTYTAQFRLAADCQDGEYRKAFLNLDADLYYGYLEDFLLENYGFRISAFLYEFPSQVTLSGTISELGSFEEEMEGACALLDELALAKRNVKKLTDLSPDTYLDTLEEGYSRKENETAYLKEAARACAAYQTAHSNLRMFLSQCQQVAISYKADGAKRLVEWVKKIAHSLEPLKKRKLEPDLAEQV